MDYSYDFNSLNTKYKEFEGPVGAVKIDGKSIAEDKGNILITDIEVELTSDMEASIATFRLYNVFDQEKGEFKVDKIKKYICLGSSVEIGLGYFSEVIRVFVGFIARTDFVYEKGDVPCIEITAMDLKGIMMSGNYSLQLKATSYSGAVREIMQKTAYEKLQDMGIITSLSNIKNTPDDTSPEGGVSGLGSAGGAEQKDTDETIEMVAESDYEFVVKAAKKFNFEFFVIDGDVYFRSAKSDSTVLMELGIKSGLLSFDLGYDITGMVERVQARGMDVGKGKAIIANKKYEGKYSIGKNAKKLTKKSAYTYIDASIRSMDQAQKRAESVMEDISYRLGNMECECVGIPELIPGKFIKISGLGKPAENIYYVTKVRHVLNADTGYITYIYGKTNSVEATADSGSGIMGSLSSMTDVIGQAASAANSVADVASKAADVASQAADMANGIGATAGTIAGAAGLAGVIASISSSLGGVLTPSGDGVKTPSMSDSGGDASDLTDILASMVDSGDEAALEEPVAEGNETSETELEEPVAEGNETSETETEGTESEKTSTEESEKTETTDGGQ